jgi:hypothetical protein
MRLEQLSPGKLVDPPIPQNARAAAAAIYFIMYKPSQIIYKSTCRPIINLALEDLLQLPIQMGKTLADETVHFKNPDLPAREVEHPWIQNPSKSLQRKWWPHAPPPARFTPTRVNTYSV